MKLPTLLCVPVLCFVVSTAISAQDRSNNPAAKDPAADDPARRSAAMFRGGVNHSGVYDAAGVPRLTGAKWKFHTNGYVFSSPAVANGVVYVGSSDGNLYAID
jgi:hypothetical protein